MKALVDKEVVEQKPVVLWRETAGEEVSASAGLGLEVFFGAMAFKPARNHASASHQELTSC
jgi:hypothetical protein